MRLRMVFGLWLALAPALVQAQGVPVQLPPAGCSSLDVSFAGAQGAAGTILDILQLTNTSTSTCVLNGYVTVQMLDASDSPLPTVSVPGGGIFMGFPGPAAVMLAPGASAPFGITWSDVPTGTEMSCAAAARLAITPPGWSTPLLLDGVSIAPCNGGRINVGPIRAPGSTIPS